MRVMQDSCFYGYDMLYWIESGIEQSICAGNSEV
jgi:hypothetical protein